jgi:large subunit ribosomal protein L10
MEKKKSHVGKERSKPVPEFKKKLVDKIAEKIKSSRTILIASTKSLPASKFQLIKKKLRGKAEVVIAKKSIFERAISKVEKGALQNLKKELGADITLIFSNIDAFELASLLIDNQTPAKAKVGDIAPEDINVEPGPTELMPGPAISELGAVGLKVAVENGKLAIKEGRTIVKAGEVIDEKSANVMAKLNILPMKVGFIPLSAYDAESETIYTEIKIDKQGALEELKTALSKALGFAVSIGYPAKETITFFIAKASAEEKALSVKLGEEKIDEVKEEKTGDNESRTEQSEGAEEEKSEKPTEEKDEQTK